MRIWVNGFSSLSVGLVPCGRATGRDRCSVGLPTSLRDSAQLRTYAGISGSIPPKSINPAEPDLPHDGQPSNPVGVGGHVKTAGNSKRKEYLRECEDQEERADR